MGERPGCVESLNSIHSTQFIHSIPQFAHSPRYTTPVPPTHARAKVDALTADECEGVVREIMEQMGDGSRDLLKPFKMAEVEAAPACALVARAPVTTAPP